MRGYRPSHAGGPWTSFWVAVLFLLLFSLLPLGAELGFTGQITVASLTLVTATYATSLSMSSRGLLSWAFGVMVGLVFSSAYGWSVALDGLEPAYRLDEGSTAGEFALWAPTAMLAVIFTLHLGERYYRHMRRKELFPDFLKP